HWWQRRQRVTQHPNARRGLRVVLSLGLVFGSGLALLVAGEQAWVRWTHGITSAVLFVFLVWHASWALHRWGARGQWSPALLRLVLINLELGLAAVGFVTLILAAPAPTLRVPADRLLIAHASLQQRRLATAEQCAMCHAPIVAEWQQSAHAHAVNDAYYQALTTLFIEERGVEAARYCASCHNPIGLMQGEIARDAVVPEEDQGNAYAARNLGVSLAVSHRAAEGVTCVVCHRAAHAPAEPSNGNLALHAGDDADIETLVAQMAARAAPTDHRQSFQPELLAEARLCGTCHNLFSPDGTLALEPTYDEWLASPYPGQGVTCQSCHFRNAAQTVIHGGRPGAPSSLPGLSQHPELLQTALTLEVQATRTASELALQVVVTNSGAGHYVPTGADDLRQIWLEVAVFSADGQQLWHSGGLDRYGQLAPEVVRFVKVLGDADGRPIDLHRFWMATQILSDTRLAPLEARTVSYQVQLPPALLAQAHQMTATVYYRDVSQAFAEFAGSAEGLVYYRSIAEVTAVNTYDRKILFSSSMTGTAN
ncbi:MAG: hypothetical protein EOM24_23100, partial [Chloroflexia bacterium]|nr:hypothetical protein [Chloroflexia bacterium]